jgi:hypothetical protein
MTKESKGPEMFLRRLMSALPTETIPTGGKLDEN